MSSHKRQRQGGSGLKGAPLIQTLAHLEQIRLSLEKEEISEEEQLDETNTEALDKLDDAIKVLRQKVKGPLVRSNRSS